MTLFLQLIYKLCVDPLTCDPMMDLLSSKKYQFFVKVVHQIVHQMPLNCVVYIFV